MKHRQPNQEALIKYFIRNLSATPRLLDSLAEESEEDRFLRHCFEEPDGFDEEFERIQRLATTAGAKWSLPRIEGGPP
jgi:hypothetical protein